MKFLTILVLLTTLLIFQPQSVALYAEPDVIPAERLIKNLTQYITEHPDEAQAHYILGRVHYRTFMNKLDYVSMYHHPDYSHHVLGKSFPYNFPGPMQRGRVDAYEIRMNKALEKVAKEQGTTLQEIKYGQLDEFGYDIDKHFKALKKEDFPHKLSQQQLLDHAANAVKHLTIAKDLNSNYGLYYLTLASFLKQFKDNYPNIPESELPEILRGVTTEKIASLFYLAFVMSNHKELRFANENKGKFNLMYSTAREAGHMYISMLSDSESKKPHIRARIKKIKQFNKWIQKVAEYPWITPIVFTLTPHTSINDLLQPTLSVSFDLDGDGLTEAWPWLKPSTALLVWDPEHTSNITSGRQLFGTATWWMLFSDGYRALASLDDNQDGALSGDELEGIAAWFDHNSDGISQPGEVTPLRELGIASFATTATGETQGMLMNEQGITLEDGQILPSYDWVTQSTDKAVTLPLRLH